MFRIFVELLCFCGTIQESVNPVKTKTKRLTTFAQGHHCVFGMYLFKKRRGSLEITTLVPLMQRFCLNNIDCI